MKPTSIDSSITAQVIFEKFRGLIVIGYLGSGERLPTVRQTAADLGVALGTAARAYKQLEQEGLVTTRTGAGTRVAAGASPLPRDIVAAARQSVLSAKANGIPLAQLTSAIGAIWSVED